MRGKARILGMCLGLGIAACAATTVQAEWMQNANGYYYVNNGQVVYNNWLRMTNTDGSYVYYYIGQDGYMETGWVKINNVWYYFNENGTMATGWKQVNGEWYYLQSNGQMATGWLNVNENGTTKYYYLKESGAMVKGWRQIGGAWYYFLDDGTAVINQWARVNNLWYCFGTDGKMITGWHQQNGVYYYIIKNNGVTNEIWSIRDMGQVSNPSAWTKVNGNALTGYEGPSLVKFNGQYWLYTDKLDSYPAGSADGKNGIFVQRSNSLASRRVMLAIIVMFAASDTHWQATLPAMYFLLSLTVPISLLFIIMRNNLELVASNR